MDLGRFNRSPWVRALWFAAPPLFSAVVWAAGWCVEQSALDRLNALRAELAVVPALEQSARSARLAVAGPGAEYADGMTAESVAARASGIALHSGVTVNSVRTESRSAVTLSMEGPFHALGKFLDELQQPGVPVTVDSLHMNGRELADGTRMYGMDLTLKFHGSGGAGP